MDHRYGGEFVPVTHVTDVELGLAELRSELPYSPDDDFSRLSMSRRDQILRAIAHREREILLEESDFVTTLPAQARRTAPAAWAAHISIEGEDEGSIDECSFRFRLLGVSGPSGTETITRFAYADAELLNLVRFWHEHERNLYPDDALVEIVHFPNGHMGNVTFRPKLRDIELTFLGRTTTDAMRLPLSDLQVAAQGGKLVLYSPLIGRRVRPRLTTAHNFHHTSNLPVYRLLGMIAAQDAGRIAFGWGALARSAYLPRIVLGSAILAPARWSLDGADVRAALATDDFPRWIQAKREVDRIPRYVQLGEYDNLLALDLCRPSDQRELASRMRKHTDGLMLQEFPVAAQVVLDSTANRYFHEIVLPFASRSTAAISPLRTRNSVPVQATTSAQHAAEWIQVNLYTGSILADVILRDHIRPFVRRHTESGALAGWFFIRYGLPSYHLRVRFRRKLEDSSELRCAIDHLTAAIARAELVSDIAEAVPS